MKNLPRNRFSCCSAVSGLALALVACGGPSTTETAQNSNVTQQTEDLGRTESTSSAEVPFNMSGPLAAASADNAGPTAQTGQTTAEDAGNVVQSYYAAIDRGEYKAAYMLWVGDGEGSDKTFAQFERGFADTVRSRVDIGRLTDSEGAAGSVYIEVPVTVHATLKDGTKQVFTGIYTLRRVNDVEGATPKQLSWHIASAKLTEK